MRRFALCLGILLAWPLVTRAAGPPTPASVQISTDAWVDVDPSGRAHVVEMGKFGGFKDEGTSGSLADTIRSRLRERIETWEFAPPTKNGVAVSGKTHLVVFAVAEGDGSNGMRILIESASTGFLLTNVSIAESLVHSPYFKEGWLEVHIEFGPDGRVVDASVLASKAFDGRRFRGNLDGSLQKKVLAAVKGFTAEMERVNGEPVGGSGNLPIRICMSNACRSAEIPGAERGSEFVAAPAAVQLRTAVAGTVL